MLPYYVYYRLVTNAVPTIFNVPNPPQPLASHRRLLHRPVADSVPEAAQSEDVHTNHVPLPASGLNYNDHSYSAELDVDCVGETSAVKRGKPSTFRERQLKKVIARQRVKICRLQQRLIKMRNKGNQSALGMTPKFDQLFGKKLGGFLARQMKLSKCKKFGHRFSHGDKNFALSLYFCGPKAYSFCQQLFLLPSKRTLQLWLSTLNVSPGFCDTVLNLLGKKISKMHPRNKACLLMLDEMALKATLTYDSSKDVVVGFEDFGHLGAGTALCNNALVFMVKGLCAKWKQPIGYFVSHNATCAEKLLSLVSTALQKLSAVGLDVRVIVCDQGSTNQHMLRLLDVTVERPCVEMQGKQVTFMYDPPHLLKSIRNNLVKHDFMVNGNTVSWKYVTEFYNSDSQLQIRMAPKLTKRHIELPPFAAMRVCLAAEVLSHTVAAGISTYVALGKLPDEAIHTAEFVEAVDGLFDCFNSRNLRGTKPLHRPITNNSHSPHWAHLQKCTQLLGALKVVGSRASVPCVAGWLMNINALRIIWSALKSEYNISFLLTSRLNQDSLENLFSIIRGRGGHRDNPGPVHFQSAFKQVIVQNMFMPAASANCRAEDEGDCVLSVDDFAVSPILLNDQAHSSPSAACPVPLVAAGSAIVAMDSELSRPSDIVLQNTLMYVTGYVCKKVLDKHRCQQCSSTMLRRDTMLVEQRDLFCCQKAYNTSLGNFGGLKAPSQCMFELMASCETTFVALFDNIKHEHGVRQKLNNAVEFCFAEGNDRPCMVSQRSAADLYLRTRLHYKLKFLNRELSAQATATKRNRKAMKVLHK